MNISWKALGDWLERRLARITTSGDVIHEVDGLRCVAMILVLLHHLLAYFAIHGGRWGAVSFPSDWRRVTDSSAVARLYYSGFVGVEMFFVISGFVLALPFARHLLQGGTAVALRAYYKRRLWRLEPPYVIAVGAFFFMKILLGADWHGLLPHVFATLFYVHGMVFDRPSDLEQLFWSLEVEVQFYLVAPFLAGLFLTRGRRWWLAGTILAWSGGLVLFWDGAHRYRWGLVLYLPYFLAGMLLADLYLTGKRRRSFYADLAAVAMAAWLFAGIEPKEPGAGGIGWIWPLGIAAVYASIYNGRFLLVMLSWRPVYLLGGMCYTVYMYHSNLLQLFGRLTFRRLLALPLEWDLALQGVMLTTLILAGSAVLFVMTEKPFMQRRAWRK